jgi:hypothetical protein
VQNAIERGEWGHPSSRHSCEGPAPRSALAPTASLDGAHRAPSWSIMGSCTFTLQNRTEPLEIIHCKLTKNLTALYLTMPARICYYSSLP